MSALSLSPDADATKTSISNTINSVGDVTSYATLVVAIQISQHDLPAALYAELNNALSQVQKHATSWLTHLGPEVTSAFPDIVVTFAKTFENTVSNLLKTINIINAQQQGIAARIQQQSITTELSGLVNTINQQIDTLKSIQKSLVNFDANLQKDQGTLSASSTIIQTALQKNQADQVGLSSEIKRLHSTIHSDQNKLKYMWLLGPAAEIVLAEKISTAKSEINGLNKDKSADQQQNTALLLVGKTFDGLASENAKTLTTYSGVLDVWQTLQKKYQAVHDALMQAKNEELADILQELDLQVAQTAWLQLDAFVQQLRSQGQ